MTKMKNYTWEDIQKIYVQAVAEDYKDWDKSVIAEEILGAPKKYQPGLAAAFSVVKWHKDNPERGEGPCGLCILYSIDFVCTNCPLEKKDKDCNLQGSLFADTYACEPDEKLYNVLLEIYKEAWEKI